MGNDRGFVPGPPNPMTAGQTHEPTAVATLPPGADANAVDDGGQPIAMSPKV